MAFEVGETKGLPLLAEEPEAIRPWEELLGKRAGPWLLTGFLGEGGTSLVFEGRHLFQEQKVAIKLLHPETMSEASKRRFSREAQTIQSLHHPNIVEILDFGEDPSLGHYMVLALLEGLSLKDAIQRSAPLPLSWVLGIAEQLCDALCAVHEAGVIHRDLKPSNVFLLPHQPFPLLKLIDFGTAKAIKAGDQSRLTHTGDVVGTPAYLSPEQLRAGSALTPATDIYALAVLWFEALTGKLPLDSESQVEFFLQILQNEPRKLGFYRPEFADSPLEELLERMLAKQPERRPSPVDLVWDELELACQLLDDPFDTPEHIPHIPERS